MGKFLMGIFAAVAALAAGVAHAQAAEAGAVARVISVERAYKHEAVEREVCNPVCTPEVVHELRSNGWNVRYAYAGQERQARLLYAPQPGDALPIKADGAPLYRLGPEAGW